MAVTVNFRNEEEEKALYAFLDNLNYDYQTTLESNPLSVEQRNEIIRRDTSFSAGKTSARDWDEIIHELERVYR